MGADIPSVSGKVVKTMPTKIDKLLNRVTLAMAVLAMSALVCCIFVNFYEIANRNIAGKSMYWIQDFTLIMMMWFIFPGITRVSFDKQDIIIDIFVSHFPAAVQKKLEGVICLVVFLFSALVSYESFRLMMLNWSKNMTISGIPTRYSIITMVFSFAIVAVIYLVRAVRCVTEKTGGEGK